MKLKFKTHYTLWENRAELEALDIDYYQLGKYAVEYRDLEDELWDRRAVKQIIVEEGALDDYKTKITSAHQEIFLGTQKIDFFQAENASDVDIFFMKDGIDVFISDKSDKSKDVVHLGEGFFNYAETQGGEDEIYGSDGMDFVSTGWDDDKFWAGKGHDHAYMGGGDDLAIMGEGNDWVDGHTGDDVLYGGDGDDWLKGNSDQDTLYAGHGEDLLEGGDGDDILIFNSDAGEPTTQIGDFSLMKQKDTEWNDEAVGGAGRDVFIFQYEMDAKDDVIERHILSDGRIDWMAIMRENDSPHDHWVNWNGHDIIADYEAGKDTIRLEGHTVDFKLHYIDSNHDQINDTTLIEVYSNQALMVAGVLGIDVKDLPKGTQMAHDKDSLGFIEVKNSILTKSDIVIDTSITHAADEFAFDQARELSNYVDDFDALIA